MSRDHELRANWMYDILSTYSAEQMVIIDESSKDGRTLIRKHGRTASGDDPILTVSLDKGTPYSILPALTLDGYIAVRAVESSVKGEEFFDFIVNDLLCHFFLKLDLKYTHKSNAVREVIEVAGRWLVFVPPYSPDFSPIEESFSCGTIFLILSVASHSLPYL